MTLFGNEEDFDLPFTQSQAALLSQENIEKKPEVRLS
jgi:hypothetical protein